MLMPQVGKFRRFVSPSTTTCARNDAVVTSSSFSTTQIHSDTSSRVFPPAKVWKFPQQLKRKKCRIPFPFETSSANDGMQQPNIKSDMKCSIDGLVHFIYQRYFCKVLLYSAWRIIHWQRENKTIIQSTWHFQK